MKNTHTHIETRAWRIKTTNESGAFKWIRLSCAVHAQYAHIEATGAAVDVAVGCGRQDEPSSKSLVELL